MAVPRALSVGSGEWSGPSRLHLEWLPEGERVHESDSRLTVRLGHGAAYAYLDYTYEEDGPQSGHLVLCDDGEGRATGAWVDSWHQGSSVMALEGSVHPEGVDLKGSYRVPGHPDWGWRIALRMDGDTLTLRMDNVSPEGEASLAVEARYSRAQA